ncbi:tellurite resistance/C4-dicarboxylate transporter family protein [Streptomyces sp. NBC_01465]|uniref:tellurite resistance/C4-dicarboxylate transporter family protein n=1 Tax=Streptomyces sp. NBC_01465 TaxID=2903878 RepID=UPI002E34F675|nr:tellurite resistance/C4-dicarboxylate transporter family protein [Streptomyces sp. NBC_01465]
MAGAQAVFGAWWRRVPPAEGAVVMATGIISVGLHLTGHETLSRTALVLAGVLWLLLAADFAVRLVGDRARWTAEAGTPAALTAVAATTVLGTRLSLLGWQAPAVALLVLSAVVWPVLMLAVTRQWGRRMPGGVFLVCVATQGLVVLAATLASAESVQWLARLGAVFFCLGLFLYVDAFIRFDLGNLRTGAGDQWVAGGALAISALAGAKLLAVLQLGTAVHDVLRGATLVVLALDLAWYCVLLWGEVRWPRPHYDVRRWATVFPMGMTSVATLSVAGAANVPWLEGPGRVLLWVAVAAWLAACAGAARTAVRQRR